MPRPIVEILPEFGWSTGHSGFLQGVTDYINQRVVAPYDNTEEAENERMTRLQFGRMFSEFPDPEKWSQRIAVGPAIIMSVMEGLAQDHTEPIFNKRDGKKVGRVPEMFFDDAIKHVKNKELKARQRLMYAVSLSVATRNTKWLDNPDVPQYARDIAGKAVDLVRYLGSNKAHVAKAAKDIWASIPSDDELDEMENTEKEEFKSDAELEAEKKAEEPETKNEKPHVDTENEEAITEPQQMANDALSKMWGRMEVIRPPLTETKRLQEAFKANKFLRDTGKRIVRLSRALTDGKVFRGSKKKQQAGTILLDASGSMGLTAEMIEDIVMGSPGTMVAFYDGNDTEGELKVVGAGGKVASVRQMAPAYGGNTVDGPALEWLGRQKGPRVWVSDGQVFGCNGSHSSVELHKDVSRIRKRYAIKWLDTKQFGRSSRIIEKTVAALIKNTWKDGGDTMKTLNSHGW